MNAELLNSLLEKAKSDKKGLVLLKTAAVRCQQFELAAQLREYETRTFPETQEVKQAKKQAKELELLFRMVNLNVPEDTAWLIAETLKQYMRMKGKFDLTYACKLIAKKEEIFQS